MRRDIKLNIQVLTNICIKINTYINALEQIEKASATFLETIKEQDSQAYERLSGLWEENVTANESDLKERFTAISEVLSGYIRDTGSYIAPIDPAMDMRVDIDDIYFNHNQIQVRALDFWDIIRDSGSSWGIYGEIFIYDIFKDEATNEARKQAIEAENAEEKARRERNYAKLAAFRETLEEKVWGSLFESLMGMQDIYDKRIVPFENTDDDYKKKIDHYYDEWKSFGDGWADFWDGVWDVLCGAGSAIVDLLIGLVDLLKLLGEMFAWSTLNALWADELGFMPEWLDEDVTGFFDGIGAMLKDPGSALEAMGQELFDTADEKGLAYSISYVVTDTLVGWAIGKGLGKLSKADEVAGAARYADDVAKYGDEAAEAAAHADEAVDAVTEAGEHADEVAEYADDVAEAIGEGGTAGKILSASEVDDYAFDAINGPDNADAVVLGKYESGAPTSYDAVAREMDAQYFNLDNWDELSSLYSREEIWKINERFLDIQTSSGREIYLSHNPADYIGDGSYYAQELQYLINSGYEFVQEGDIWHAIR